VAILTDSSRRSGETLIDVDALARSGVSDLSPYGGGDEPELDFFVDAAAAVE
jgi:citronellol/citronellal dehydrogenase